VAASLVRCLAFVFHIGGTPFSVTFFAGPTASMISFSRCVRALALIVAFLVPEFAVAQSPAVDPEPFFKHAEYAALKMSPSGKYIGALVPSGGRQSLAVLDIDEKSIKVVARLDAQDLSWFEWVNDKRLVFSLIDLRSGLGEQQGGGLFAIDRDGSDFKEIAPTASKMGSSGQVIFRYTQLLSTLRDGTDEIVAISNQINSRYQDVYRVDTRTGRRTLASFEKPDLVDSWVVDRK